MRLKLNIYRSDPDLSKRPEYQTFEIDADPGESVSGVLQQIYENVDSTLAFRYVCNMQKCGECAVLVNGSPCLSCDRKIDSEMRIDPLPNLPIIKDLIIDRNKIVTDIFKMEPFLKERTCGSKKQVTYTRIFDAYIELGKCIGCLICQSVCPARKTNPNEFVGPLGLLWLAQKTIVCFDDGDYWRIEVQKMLQKCHLCGKCREVCPYELDIFTLLPQLGF